MNDSFALRRLLISLDEHDGFCLWSSLTEDETYLVDEAHLRGFVHRSRPCINGVAGKETGERLVHLLEAGRLWAEQLQHEHPDNMTLDGKEPADVAPLDTSNCWLGPMPAGMNQYQIDIWNVLVAARRRLMRKEIEARLNTDGRGMETSTLKTKLAEMVKKGWLSNSQDLKPQGYGPRHNSS